MTTAAGPQLLRDCHTCFMSVNAACVGAETGSGSASAATGAGALPAATGGAATGSAMTLSAAPSVGVVSTSAALSAVSTGRNAAPPPRTMPIVSPKAAADAPRTLMPDIQGIAPAPYP